jgi:putative DNA primase/helicase
MTAPPTKEQIKAAADRAEARARGETAKEFVATSVTEGEQDAEIEKLAALPIGVYESSRVAAAKRLGMRASIVDKLVAAARPKSGDGEAGAAIKLIARTPAETEVNGSILLAGIIRQFDTYVFLSYNEKLAAALWVIASYAFDGFFIFPRLRLKSATKGCGKSTLLDILECLVNKPLIPSNATGPSLFRIIAIQRPTILLDEADRFVPKNDDLISIIDAGHKKNGTVLRCVGDDQEPRWFSVWAPMAIAAIRSLPGTIEHRAVVIDMQRRPPGQKLKRFRADRPPNELAELASQAARWAADHQVALGNADPKIPDGLSNRAADNWLPLLAVAEAIGGDLVEKVRKAAMALQHGDDDELGVRLLADIKEVFTSDAMHSVDLVEALIAREGAPWAEINRGKALTQAKLSSLLADFGIHPEQVKIGGVNRRGYRREQFGTVFVAYFPPNAAQPPFQTATSATELKDQEKIAYQSATSELPGSTSKGEIASEKQSGSAGSTLKPPVDANGQGRGPISDYDASIEELRERGDLTGNDCPDLPTFLDRRGEPPCDRCGLPGGTELDHDGLKPRLHSHCVRPWIDAYEARRNGPMGSSA